MRIEWLNKKGAERVVVFFNGWGMDRQAVSHLQMACDVVMVCDYRNLEEGDLPELNAYPQVYVVAWSMGVWAAANIVPRLHIQLTALIGLNGTECPVSDRWGIPIKGYQLTERGMNEKGREKFLLRMLDGPDEISRFGQNRFQRPIEEVCEELTEIRRQSTGLQNKLKWNKIYISGKDVIFPVTNQENWWSGRCADIRVLSGGHYPFYQFRSWEDIIG